MTADLEKIISCPSLPSLPAVAIEVLELTRDPNVSIKEIARVVENDQAIAAKVLRTINSSYYGLASPCPTIQRAMGYLGLNTVRSLVLGFSLVDSFKGSAEDGGFDLQAHWRRAIFGATGARATASAAGRVDPDEAFIASMLQDVGMLAASMALGDNYNAAIAEVSGDHFDVQRIEKERFDFTHSEVGALLAERWSLPECMSQAVRYHHKPESAPADHRDLIRTVALSTIAAEALTVSSPKVLVNRFKTLGSDWFDLPVNNAKDLLQTISENSGELSRLFQLDTGTIPDVSAIMAEAQDQQIATQISMERERRSLESTATELEKESNTDGLTNIANRKRFDQELEKAFAEASQGGSLAVLFMDADKFKLVNDTYGHQAGDEILIELARRATEVVGDAGIVCRYGGEEFAVVAPGADRMAGARIAEKIRKAIEEKPFDVSEVLDCPTELRITISLGVAAVEQSSFGDFEDSAALLKAADTAVYAAKKGGRNCTRVYKAAKVKTIVDKQAKTVVSDNPPQSLELSSKHPPSSPVIAKQSSVGAITVLLVEDDLLHLNLLKRVIAEIDSVNACAVTTAEEALSILGLGEGPVDGQGLVPDIMLCDLALPGISGQELIKVIRESSVHDSMPLIVLSATDNVEESRSCVAAGANAFVTKQRFADNPAAMIKHLIGFWTMALVAA